MNFNIKKLNNNNNRNYSYSTCDYYKKLTGINKIYSFVI